MANTSIVFSKVSGYADFVDTNFLSQVIASGASSTAPPVGYAYAIVKPMGGNVWLAFTTDGTAPDAGVNPRIPLDDGETFTFHVKPNTRMTTLDRT